jgi:hypothetical protein
MEELMVDQVIKLKRNTSNTTAPTTSDIVVGEVAISAVDGKLYIRKQDDSIKSIDANEDDVIALAIALG